MNNSLLLLRITCAGSRTGVLSCLDRHHATIQVRKTYIHNRTSSSINDFTRGTIPFGGQGIAVDQYAEVQRIFTPKEINNFGTLISDNNPIHQLANEESHPLSENKTQIVHGILTASVFSSIFGTLIPGSIYRSQKLVFQSPVYSNESIIGRVQVTKVKDMKSRGLMVTCDTIVYKNYDGSKNIQDCDNAIVCISGEATVWLPNKTISSEN